MAKQPHAAPELTLDPELPPVVPTADEAQQQPNPASAEPPGFGFEFLDETLAETKAGPYSGDVVVVSDDLESPGCFAKYVTTRKFIKHRWRLWSGWVDPISRKEIPFVPVLWRPAYDWSRPA